MLDVAEQGDEVTVSVYGGDPTLCTVLTFQWPDVRERRAMLAILDGWARTDEPVVVITRPDEVRLVSERRLLARAAERS